MAAGKRWARDELFVTLNIYHKLTFGAFHSRNPVIVKLAEKLKRTPGSIAMKLSNFASFDPHLKLRGIQGLAGASNLDRVVWDEFHAELNETVPDSENALRELFEVDEDTNIIILPKLGFQKEPRRLDGETEIEANVKQRRGQDYFRESVLNNFGGRCGVSQIALRDLLIASHILPWSSNPDERLNVRNGLCLSRLHDAAFDRGLIAFDDNFQLMLSSRLTAELNQKAIDANFGKYEGKALNIPQDAALPEPAFLATHRENIFED
ncbi:MAG: HNH endonuclease [Verrucomicrobia subdivision 3 bacterium]|nr:HNH endonuclease [Limisphaerales bacterium]